MTTPPTPTTPIPSPGHPRPAEAVAAAFARRADRAQALAAASFSAQAPLVFAAGLYRAQAALADVVARAHAARPLQGRLDVDLERFAGTLAVVLRFVAAHGPAPLAAQAAALLEDTAGDPRPRLRAFWTEEDASGRDDYLARALLRPYTEVLAAAEVDVRPDRGTVADAPGRCPFCGGRPWIAARRAPGQTSGADGAQRILGCSLCGGEWPVSRIHCPACSEETPDKLASFQTDRYPTARIEACTTCAVYVKSIDLTLDARAIPEVDDLVTLALDLWAAEQGYTRLEPGLAGV